MAETELSRAYLQTDTCYSEDDIAAIGDDGILFSDGCKASFAACAETFAEINRVQTGRCIGCRDITAWRFVLYTLPHPTVIQFHKKPWIAELFSTPAHQRFFKLQKAIADKGFSTLDLS